MEDPQNLGVVGHHSQEVEGHSQEADPYSQAWEQILEASYGDEAACHGPSSRDGQEAGPEQVAQEVLLLL